MIDSYDIEKENIYNKVKEDYINDIKRRILHFWRTVYVSVYSDSETMIDHLIIPSCRAGIVMWSSMSRLSGNISGLPNKDTPQDDNEFRDFENKYKNAISQFIKNIKKKYATASDYQLYELAGNYDLAAVYKLMYVYKKPWARHRAISLSNELYKRISQEYPGASQIPRDKWAALCDKAGSIRNRVMGHVTITSLNAISPEELDAEIVALIDTIKPLVDDRNHEEFERIETERQSYYDELKTPLTCIMELVNPEVNLNGEEIGKILRKFYAVKVSGQYALMSYEEAQICIQDYIERKQIEAFSVYELVSELAVSKDTVLSLLSKSGHIVINNKVCTGKKDQIIQMIKGKLQESANGDSRNISASKLSELSRYTSGFMNTAQICELIDTHLLLLDISVVCSESGRDFIKQVLIPELSDNNKRSKAKYLIMDASSRLILFKKTKEYKELDKIYKQTDWDGKDTEEKKSLRVKIDELEKYKAAYYFVEDYLNKYAGLICFEGSANAHHSEIEAIQSFIEDNANKRICVLTSGLAANKMSQVVLSYMNPLLCVSRIVKNRFSTSKELDSQIQIFPQFLPLYEVYIDETPDAYNQQLAQSIVDVSESIESLPGQKESITHPEDEISLLDNALKNMDDTRIILEKEISVGSVVFNDKQERIILETYLIEDGQRAEGGEGTLYVTNIPGYVAKIYHVVPDNYRLTVGRWEKLQHMVQQKVNDERICWPTELLYDSKGVFVGFLMPLAPKGSISLLKSVLQISKPTIQTDILPGWDRLDLVKVCKSIAGLMSELHSYGILMGDVNPGNILVNPADSSKVYFVDCDSYQFDGYACPVGTVDFTHPGTADRIGAKDGIRFDSYLRTESEEDFVVAMLIFQILMLNEYPYTVKNMTPAEAMAQRLFPYNTEDVKSVPDGYSWMIWKNLPVKICNAFNRVLKEWEDVSSSSWRRMLEEYEKDIANHKYSALIIPKKYIEYNPENPIYVDVKCSICGSEEYNVHKKKYDQLIKKKLSYRCPICTSLQQKWSKISDTGVCDNCGNEFETSLWSLNLRLEHGYNLYCEKCSNPEVYCIYCGKQIIDRKSYLRKIMDGAPMCEDCRTIDGYDVECEDCGFEFKVSAKTYRGMYFSNDFRCRKCRGGY